jgi:hypothetical protein
MQFKIGLQPTVDIILNIPDLTFELITKRVILVNLKIWLFKSSIRSEHITKKSKINVKLAKDLLISDDLKTITVDGKETAFL